MSAILEKEFAHYLAHQAWFVERFDGPVIGLKDGKVLGDFDTHLAAYTALSKEHELGTFLLQRVSPGDRDTTVTFTSRAVFP